MPLPLIKDMRLLSINDIQKSILEASMSYDNRVIGKDYIVSKDPMCIWIWDDVNNRVINYGFRLPNIFTTYICVKNTENTNVFIFVEDDRIILPKDLQSINLPEYTDWTWEDFVVYYRENYKEN